MRRIRLDSTPTTSPLANLRQQAAARATITASASERASTEPKADGSRRAPVAFGAAGLPGATAAPSPSKGPAWLVVGAVAVGSLLLLGVVAGIALGSGHVQPPQAAMTTGAAGHGAEDPFRELPEPPIQPASTSRTVTDRPAPAASANAPSLPSIDYTDPRTFGGSPERALGAMAVAVVATLAQHGTNNDDPLMPLHQAGLPVDAARREATLGNRLILTGSEPQPWMMAVRFDRPTHEWRLELLANPATAAAIDGDCGVDWHLLDINDDHHTDVCAIVRSGTHDRLVVWAGPDFHLCQPLPADQRPVQVAASRDAGFRLEFLTAANDPALQPGDPVRLRASSLIHIDGDPTDAGLAVSAEYSFEPPGFALCHLSLEVGPPTSALQWLAAIKLLRQLGRTQQADDLCAAGKLLDAQGFAAIRGGSSMTHDEFRAALAR